MPYKLENIELPKSPRILVVDDDHLILDLISSLLSINNLLCDKSTSIQETKNIIKEKTYDIVFLDLKLPDGSGLDILQEIIGVNPESVVVMTTGVYDINVAVESIRIGAYDYITKPFTAELFQDRLLKVIDEWKSRVFTQKYQDHLEKLVNVKTEDLKKTVGQIEHVYDMTVRALGAALDLKDPETEEHCLRVSENSIRLGERLGINSDELKYLKWGSYLHDIGKIGISENILLKPSGLTFEEREKIKKHTILGYNMIKHIDFLSKASPVVLYHHERYDGKGYPVGLKGKIIPINARIFSVIDTFDAMTSNRPYRRALPFSVTLEEIKKGSDTQFDPEIVEIFSNIPESYWLIEKSKKKVKK